MRAEAGTVRRTPCRQFSQSFHPHPVAQVLLHARQGAGPPTMHPSLPRVLLSALTLLAASATRPALAESLAACVAPTLYVAKDVIGVEGSFDDLSAKLYTDSDAGRVEVPIEIAPSEDSACHSNVQNGFRVLAKEPLRVGASYVLEAQLKWSDCGPRPGASLLRFTAVGDVALPTELPVPAPELLVMRCPSRPDYFFYNVDAPSLPTAPDVRLRLSVDGDLHYCVEHGMRGERCAPGGQPVRRLRWVAQVPHTGLRFDGALTQVVLECDSAREVPCPQSLVPDAGVRSQDASAPRKGDAAAPVAPAPSIGSHDDGAGCSLSPRAQASQPLPGLLCLLFLLFLLPARKRSRLQRTLRP